MAACSGPGIAASVGRMRASVAVPRRASCGSRPLGGLHDGVRAGLGHTQDLPDRAAPGSITRAAERCGTATSAAAKRIQALEADGAVSLLERGARGVRPTAAGEAFARYARTAGPRGPARRRLARLRRGRHGQRAAVRDTLDLFEDPHLLAWAG